MAISEARKKANAKWDKANTMTVSCKLRKEEHAAFKAYAEQRGLTVSGALLEYVRKCITETEQSANMEQTEQIGESTEQKSET